MSGLHPKFPALAHFRIRIVTSSTTDLLLQREPTLPAQEDVPT